MPGWTLVDAHPTQGRTFQRPLDTIESFFFWGGLFSGATDTVWCYELRLFNGARDADVFSTPNITRAWLSTKRRLPLAGATVRGPSGPLRPRSATGPTTEDHDISSGAEFTPEPHFVVQEHDLAVLRPHEVVFGWVSDREEAQQRAVAIADGPRMLSEEVLVRLYVFRQTERVDVLYLVALAAHCITDRVASTTFARCLFDTLAGGMDSDSDPAQIPLEDRLAMAISSTALALGHLRSLSLAKRRWRNAVGLIIYQLHIAKRQGGHTLPCRIMRSTPLATARSGCASIVLTLTQSATIVANCRLHNITFGNAFLPLAQVAMTRVLYRRYLRGEISEEEWSHRRRQPYISGGPLNLRPYLDKEWFENGGGGEFTLAIDFYHCQLPFMTLGAAADHKDGQERTLSDGAPPFSELLTFDRFLHRAGLVKRQVRTFFAHPLFFEILHAASLSHLKYIRPDVQRWCAGGCDGDAPSRNLRKDEDEVLSIMDMPVVWAHRMSSSSNADFMLPSEYPLPPTHPLSPYSPVPHPAKAGYVTPLSSSKSTSEVDTTPKIAVECLVARLHPSPSELYLQGVADSHGQLELAVTYDGNVFDDEVTREWLGEVKGAIVWYLGQTHHRSGRIGQAGFGEGVRTKL